MSVAKAKITLALDVGYYQVPLSALQSLEGKFGLPMLSPCLLFGRTHS